MALPTLNTPTFKIPVYSKNNKEYDFRPFLVKEEKLLLMAKESQNDSDIFQTIKQIVNNCCLDNNFEVDKLAIFELEYIFIKLRSFSVDNIIKVSYRDEEDGQNYTFDVDLSKIEINYPEKNDNNIKISNDFGILMKYPSASLYDDKEFLNLDKDYLFELILRCIDKIYEKDDVYESKNYSIKEISEFLDGLDSKTFASIQNFLLNAPNIKYTLEYKNSLGKDKQIVLSSLNDFFTFR